MRRDEQQTARPFRAINLRVLASRSKASVNEAHQPRTFRGHNQPVAIEPRFGQHMLFDGLRRNRLKPPADRTLRPPDFSEPRWVTILKGTIEDQGVARGWCWGLLLGT